MRSICVLFLLIFVGCNTTHDNTSGKPDVTVNLDSQSNSIGVVRKVLDEETDSSRTEADRIRLLAEEGRKIAPQLPQWDEIKKSADKMSESLLKLSEATKALAEIEVQLKLAAGEIARMRLAMDSNIAKVMELNGIIEQQKKLLEEFQNGIKARQQKVWLGVTTFSALILVIGIFLLVYADRKLGMALVISALTLTSVSYFMAQYVVVVAMIGGGLLFIVIAILIYHVFVNRKEIFIHKTALVETVKTVDKLKPTGWNEGEHEDLKEEIRGIQSPTTVELIDEIRCEHGQESGKCSVCGKSK